jgi:protein-tyrosine-phosphatase
VIQARQTSTRTRLPGVPGPGRRCYPNLIQHIRLSDAAAIPDPWSVDQDRAYADALDRIEQAARAYLANLKAVRNAADC